MGFSIHRGFFRICVVLASCKFTGVGMKEMVSRCLGLVHRFFAVQFSFGGVGGLESWSWVARRVHCWSIGYA